MRFTFANPARLKRHGNAAAVATAAATTTAAALIWMNPSFTSAALVPTYDAITQGESFPVGLSSRTLVGSTAQCHSLDSYRRTKNSAVDTFFRKHGQLPNPKVMHATLPAANISDSERTGILVIGDVHGCFRELCLLYEKSVQENNGKLFHYVILVGDLCRKGPNSEAVIRHIRTSDRWLSVRGNHDNRMLRDELSADRMEESELSDEDVEWLANLPYTIRIPAATLNEDRDTIIVHAGLIPGVELEEQTIETMVTLREIPKESDQSDQSSICWASCWKGPERVIFGHDAKRGLQQNDYTIGLDTGAVYGGQLTGIILPRGKLVHIHSLDTYCAIRKL